MLSMIPRASILVMTNPILPTRWEWFKLQVRLWFARARCLVRGHVFTRRAWVHVETREVAQYHCGCIHCDLYWEETPHKYLEGVVVEGKFQPRCFFRRPRPTMLSPEQLKRITI